MSTEKVGLRILSYEIQVTCLWILGGTAGRQPIGAEGRAFFPAIPPTFRGQEVPIGVESAVFELSDAKQSSPTEARWKCTRASSCRRKGPRLRTTWVTRSGIVRLGARK
jgi:hypothetical protein